MTFLARLAARQVRPGQGLRPGLPSRFEPPPRDAPGAPDPTHDAPGAPDPAADAPRASAPAHDAPGSGRAPQHPQAGPAAGQTPQPRDRPGELQSAPSVRETVSASARATGKQPRGDRTAEPARGPTASPDDGTATTGGRTSPPPSAPQPEAAPAATTLDARPPGPPTSRTPAPASPPTLAPPAPTDPEASAPVVRETTVPATGRREAEVAAPSPGTEGRGAPEPARSQEEVARLVPGRWPTRTADVPAPLSSAAPPEPPAVEVTIGRLEVHAVSPPRPVRRRDEAKPVLSLEDYLAGRHGGTRP